LLLAAGLAGCATPPAADDPDAIADYNAANDPFEPTNRVIYAVNDGVDTVFIKPLALLYRNVVPDPIQRGAHNALANLASPVVLANDMLEGKPKRAGDTLMRLLINTTAGVGGLFDVADDSGYHPHDADFGMTLALWGAGSGPYIFLPVFGPSNPRDTIGMGGDYLLDPLSYLPSNGAIGDAKLAKTGLSGLDARAGVLDQLDKVKASALDPYATIRSLSRQYRQKQIDDAAAAH
jgi:phospholipid-binding lipoprotein MlaA